MLGACGLTLAASLSFFGRLLEEVQGLYYRVEGQLVLRAGRKAAAFTELTDWYWKLWLPVLLLIPALGLCHYLYYYRETRSIYVMRRIPARGGILRSCVQGSLLFEAMAVLLALAVYGFYFGIYWLSIPSLLRHF